MPKVKLLTRTNVSPERRGEVEESLERTIDLFVTRSTKVLGLSYQVTECHTPKGEPRFNYAVLLVYDNIMMD